MNFDLDAHLWLPDANCPGDPEKYKVEIGSPFTYGDNDQHRAYTMRLHAGRSGNGRRTVAITGTADQLAGLIADWQSEAVAQGMLPVASSATERPDTLDGVLEDLQGLLTRATALLEPADPITATATVARMVTAVSGFAAAEIERAAGEQARLIKAAPYDDMAEMGLR